MAENKREEFALQVFNGTQYDKWKFRLKSFLEMKECLEVIEEDNKPENCTDADWKKKEIKAKNYIVHSVSDTQLEIIISEPTARRMILKLDETYLIKSSALKLLCKRKLLELKMEEGEDPSDFFNEFEKLTNELTNAGETVSREDKLNYLLLALPESMSRIVDVVDALPDQDKSIEYVKSKLKLEYQKGQSTKNNNSQNDFQVFSSSRSSKMLDSRQSNARKQYNEPTSFSRSPERKYRTNNQTQRCFKCNKPGHIQRFCRYNRNWQERPAKFCNAERSTGTSERDRIENKNSFNVEVMKARLDTHYALRVLKYLHGTSFLKLKYEYGNSEVIDAYVDADWASDTIDRKSTTGIIIRVFGNSILWKSQKQKIVSRASTHAEYYALANCVEEILPIRGILNELEIKLHGPVTIYEDNAGAILLAKNGNFSKNSKHIDISYHFIYDYEKKGLIQEPYVFKGLVGSYPGFRVIQPQVEYPWVSIVVMNGEIETFQILYEETEHVMCVQVKTVTTDANASAKSWFSDSTCQRGKLVEEFIASNNLYIVNKPCNVRTFSNVTGSSNIDITIVTGGIFKEIVCWNVHETCVLSDHNLITFYYSETGNTRAAKTYGECKYKINRADWMVFRERLNEVFNNDQKETLGEENIDRVVQVVSKKIDEVCGKSMPRCRKFVKKVPWWNDRISNLRKEAYRIKKELSRGRRLNLVDEIDGL
ncbi:hypothetical protein KPH14_000538, partial [Odynerus spinipes]